MKMSGHTVLITGGTGGIGYALAARLLKRGNTILITGRTEDRLAAARESLPGVHTFVCDQSDPTAIARLCADVTRAFPTLDVLINNAGIGLKRNLNDADTPLEDLEREIRINLTGPIQLAHALLPHLKRQDAALIVNVTSGLAFVPLPLKPIYCATKAAMHSYSQSLRVQLSRTSVRVIELAPPAVATDFNKGQEEMNAGPRMNADAFARAAIRGLEQSKDEVLPGAAKVLRLIARLNPRATLRRAAAAALPH
eukprot:gene16419-16597_t